MTPPLPGFSGGRAASSEELLADLGWVRGLARSLVADDAAAEDLAQETWLRVLRRPTGERPSRSWLATVLRNLVLDRARRAPRRERRERSAARAEATPSAEELVHGMELRRVLAEELVLLPEPLRTPLLLLHGEELEPAAIAAALGLPPSTVRTRLQRARALLKERLDRRFDGRRGWLPGLALLARPAGGTGASLATLVTGALAMKPATVLVSGLVLVLAALGLRHALRGEPRPPASVAARPAELDAPAAQGSPGPVAERVALPAPAPERAEAGPRPLPPLRARLVDEATGEPLPFFRLEHADAAGEELETDAEGRFAVRDAGPERTDGAGRAPHVLLLRDGEHPENAIDRRRREIGTIPTSVELEDSPVDREDVVRAPAGPTFRFRLELPEGVELADLRARLSCADPLRAFDRVYAPLRTEPLDGNERRAGGPEPWARFSALARLLEGGPPWSVRLESEDGLWLGAAEVEEREGRHPEPLEIRLLPRAALAGTVRDAAGRPLERVLVKLVALDPDVHPALAGAPTDEEGAYRVRWVAPGRWRAEVEARGHATFTRELVLRPGEAETLDVRLASDGKEGLPRGVVEGRVTSETGRYDGSLFVILADEAGTWFDDPMDVTWSGPAGNRVGTFRFEDVPLGTWVLAGRSGDPVEIEPAVAAVRPGDPPLELLVEDGGARVELEVRAFDPATGEPVRAFRAELDAGEDLALDLGRARETGDGVVRFPGLAPDTPFALLVVAPEHVPWRLPLTTADEAGTLLRAPLARGWGARIVAVDGGGAPLANVEVLADGDLLGRTDAGGKVDVSLPATPRHLALRHPELVLLPGGPVDPDTGTFRTEAWTLRLVLGPR